MVPGWDQAARKRSGRARKNGYLDRFNPRCHVAETQGRRKRCVVLTGWIADRIHRHKVGGNLADEC